MAGGQKNDESGDFEEAQVIFDELGMDRLAGAMQRRGNIAGMKEALDNADYDAFMEVAPDYLKSVVTEDNFNRFVEAHELLESGDMEGAREIMDELGVRPPRRVGRRNNIGNGEGTGLRDGMGARSGGRQANPINPSN